MSDLPEAIFPDEPNIIRQIRGARDKVLACNLPANTLLLGANSFKQFLAWSETKNLFDSFARDEHTVVGFRGKFLGVMVWEVETVQDLVFVLPMDEPFIAMYKFGHA
jgi:hypothetical protein